MPRLLPWYKRFYYDPKNLFHQAIMNHFEKQAIVEFSEPKNTKYSDEAGPFRMLKE